jgi:hypothetical protein
MFINIIRIHIGAKIFYTWHIFEEEFFNISLHYNATSYKIKRIFDDFFNLQMGIYQEYFQINSHWNDFNDLCGSYYYVYTHDEKKIVHGSKKFKVYENHDMISNFFVFFT